MQKTSIYKPKNKVRIVTAASLFDGHDAAINIMRRIIQSTGCDVLHLGPDSSVEAGVDCEIADAANSIAMTSYPVRHSEYLTYMFALLQQTNAIQFQLFV